MYNVTVDDKCLPLKSDCFVCAEEELILLVLMQISIIKNIATNITILWIRSGISKCLPNLNQKQ